jgi:hypothetical protein
MDEPEDLDKPVVGDIDSGLIIIDIPERNFQQVSKELLVEYFLAPGILFRATFNQLNDIIQGDVL